jgi:hypothetical protein
MKPPPLIATPSPDSFPVPLLQKTMKFYVSCDENFFWSLQVHINRGFIEIRNTSKFLKILVPACPG